MRNKQIVFEIGSTSSLRSGHFPFFLSINDDYSVTDYLISVILDEQVVGSGSSDASSSNVFALSGFTVGLSTMKQ